MPNAKTKELPMVMFTIRRSATLAAALCLTALTLGCSDQRANGRAAVPQQLGRQLGDARDHR